ncbi:MAG: asparagine synthase (glutamine-hydrolyzing) [Proteobacteria bacterium]|nr:asparagine synthase (glutamine-hydrolyzing) [Pseudomonadota bacterium]MBU1593900.1 asparagine synthase (glutamine-hydrolyzing) [Pseudomonadota bacterium]
MCGIAGILSPDAGPGQQGLLRRMTDTLHHRGPDDSDLWLDEATGLGLGHRRLSIIDLSPLGRQPMRSASGRYVLCFNGEVFNFARLRAELAPLGHAFRGGSDTEVMLAAIEQWGLFEAVKRFVGMFAFALWDRQERTLSLVRDRLGIKPLYYGLAGRDFVFGSELKALREHPAFDADIDREALTLYFRHDYIPAPFSIHRGAKKLPPGQILTLAPGRGPALAPYWSAQEVYARGAQNPSADTEAEALDRLEALLKDAVGLRMLADVPLGAFLSGGIDSSLVVALMQAQSPRPVKTFSIGFAEAAFNEAPHARAVAEHLGCEHTELMLTQQDLLDIVPLVPRFWDEPFADSSQIPTYAVCRLAREHVTVALSGDGGDELFFGYERYPHAAKWWKRLALVPLPLRLAVAKTAWLRPERFAQLFGRAGQRVLWRLDALGKPNFQEFYKRLLSHHPRPWELVRGSGPEPRTALDLVPPEADAYRAMSLWDILMYLPDDILTKVDRASMAVSLEARVPLLDHRVVEFAASLPTRFKVQGGGGKHLLRQLLYRHVPRDIVDRPKMGFGIPLAQWLPGRLRPWAEDVLATGRRQSGDVLDFALVDRYWREMLGGSTHWTYILWDVLMFLAWRMDLPAAPAQGLTGPDPSVTQAP